MGSRTSPSWSASASAGSSAARVRYHARTPWAERRGSSATHRLRTSMTGSERLRLLLVSGGRGPFGAGERLVWELATRLPETRYQILVWLPPESELDELAQSLEERGVAVERISEPRSRLDLPGLAAIGASLRRWKPDLLHLHLDDGAGHRGLPALARLAGVP